jgi:hypothetical protein
MTAILLVSLVGISGSGQGAKSSSIGHVAPNGLCGVRSRREQRQERCGRRVGTDSAHEMTHALLCQECLLQGETVIYRIRPRDEKASSSVARGPKDSVPLAKRQTVVAGGRCGYRSESTAWFR